MRFLIITLLWLTTNAFAFNLTDIKGHKWHSDNLVGQYVVVNFWATWCPPCLKEIPILTKIKDDYPDDIVILGINHWDKVDKKAMQDFINLYHINYPIIRSKDNEKSLLAFGTIRGMPTTFIYNSAGKLISKFEGELTRETLVQLIPVMQARKTKKNK